MDWLRTIDADALEDVVNDLLAEHATTILDPDRSRIVIIDFVDNPYHGTYLTHPREICSMKPRDGTTSCHRYCTAFVLDTKKPLTLAITPVMSDEDAPALAKLMARVHEEPSDPLCAERLPHDPADFLHGAACHVCLFVSETTCERGNRFLDRRLVVPIDPDFPPLWGPHPLEDHHREP
jgi:hypothetical protein